MTRVAALDAGSSSVRAVLYDEELSALAEAREPGEAGAELDADLLARRCRDVLARVPRADAVAVSCFWHSLLALDARGRPLTGVLTWRDLRATAHAEALARRVDAREAHLRTGCPLHASFWPAKLAWLAAERPEAFRGAARFVSFAEYLLGKPRASVSTASATGLRRVDGGWDEELLAAVGVGEERLPEVSDDPVGGWFPALGDGACSNVGAGCTTADRAALMIGTSGAFRVLREERSPRPRPGLFLYRLDERRVVEGGSLSAGGNLHAWLRRTLQLPEERGLAEREPGAGGLAFLTLLGGERSPGWDATARGAISGLRFETSPLDLLQAGLEGVAHAVAEIAELMPEVREVVTTGGALAANRDWLQIVADVLERPVTAAAEPEASARGAAAVALERLGSEPPPAPLGEVFRPRPDRFAAHRRVREELRRLRSLMSPA